MPKDCGLHHEVELAVVLGQTLDEWRGGRRELSHVVEGYAVGEFSGYVSDSEKGIVAQTKADF